MKVILVSGHARNGKDTVARMLNDKLTSDGAKVLITHYADLLKFICKEFFGWNGEKDEAGRTLLQYVGTDVIRKKCPNFWVGFISTMLRFFDGNWDYVIIPDARFPNEIGELYADGFNVTHIRVNRPNVEDNLTQEQREHPSETALDKEVPDYYIENDSGLPELLEKINTFVEETLYGQNR